MIKIWMVKNLKYFNFYDQHIVTNSKKIPQIKYINI